ncbi:hypothetical protein HS041_12325 [Planomonospora sp. ID67723]|uniref:hypothetical protein n=1 Tax=Planomonospora sp. ID67723 TaxID=2738134 RepID=UPI0018C3D99B|nr:hypothetical protein [Planomonospora sp. ID67723]MBG0828555.1 hypothetical protein [Planomonospora sp. ID67723]
MATYTAEAITSAGTTFTSRSAASGDKITPDTNVWIEVTNGSGSSMTVTIAAPGTTRYGQANPDPVYTVANGATKAIPMYADYVDPSDGLIALTWSATTSVTFTVKRI